MKTIKSILIAIIFLFTAGMVQSQDVYELINDTAANSSVDYGYLYLHKDAYELDSVVFVGVFEGECDLDLFVLSRGFKYPGEASLYITEASADSTTLTVGNAAATDTYVIIYTMTKTICKGINYVRVRVEAAASGNDAADPNAVMIYAIVYRHRL